ncbi:MAG: DUF4292 domain-containing protein [Acidobacteriales bacterium]|nr:DUF4292 domain-containing protein [Terriglobales bacterium]
MTKTARVLSITICTGLLGLSGCISRTHAVKQNVPTKPILTATLEELVRIENQQAEAVKTVSGEVEIATSVGGQKKGKVTDYQEIPGYLLIRKPADLRLVGLVPVVRTHLFDMVSDGTTFRLSIPPKNRFVTGSSEVTRTSDNSLENIRPSAILNALLLPELNPSTDIAVIRTGTEHVTDLHDRGRHEVELPTYVLAIIKRKADGKSWYLDRRIVFSREDLKPHQQEIYDLDGNIVTQATYENYTKTDGVDFPYLIRILRPKEEYEINLSFDRLRLNQPLTPEQFELKQPEGSQLQVLK